MKCEIGNGMLRALLLALPFLTGCFSSPENEKPKLDSEFSACMIRASERAGEGAYSVAGTLYRQALDRALKLDLTTEIRLSALCYAAYSLNEENWDQAAWGLKMADEVRPVHEQISVREADLSLRLSWVKKNDGDRFRKRLASVVDGTGEVTPDIADAWLTLLEDRLRSGANVGVVELSPKWNEAGFPKGISIRARILKAWAEKKPEDWMDGVRAYSTMGNTSAAINEALRCAEKLHREDAARLALRIATGAHDEVRIRRARKLLDDWK